MKENSFDHFFRFIFDILFCINVCIIAIISEDIWYILRRHNGSFRASSPSEWIIGLSQRATLK